MNETESVLYHNKTRQNLEVALEKAESENKELRDRLFEMTQAKMALTPKAYPFPGEHMDGGCP